MILFLLIMWSIQWLASIDYRFNDRKLAPYYQPRHVRPRYVFRVYKLSKNITITIRGLSNTIDYHQKLANPLAMDITLKL